MVFASLTFLIFFLPVALLCYYLSPIRFRNIVLMLISFIFYLWGGGLHDTVLLLVVATTDYFIARHIPRAKHPSWWLTGAIVWNLLILAFFKYAAFFLSSLHKLFGDFIAVPGAETFTGIALPLGISFFIFETISYLIDVHNGTTKPARRWADYAMYLTFFPHLIAGPIYRYTEIVPDLDAQRRPYGLRPFVQGLFLFSFGLAKKCLIANPLAQIADLVFKQSQLSTLDAWVGSLAYTFQIYFDFSGYSTMAIGLAIMFGFHLPQNFDEPYTSSSITEFWRRWHITLSRWFRDYLYIPLGGNRAGRYRTYFNLSLVFLLCGLWHGASYNFILWGAYHGMLLVVERMRVSPLSWEEVPVYVRRVMTFIVVLFGWVLFRAESLPQALQIYQALLGMASATQSPDILIALGEDFRPLITFILAMLSLFSFRRLSELAFDGERALNLKGAAALLLLLLCGLELVAGTFNPFIYYRF